jgi:hypothetical protein
MTALREARKWLERASAETMTALREARPLQIAKGCKDAGQEWLKCASTETMNARRRLRFCFLLGLLVSAAATGAALGPSVGAQGGDLLTLSAGARARGMGNAFSAVSDDANALLTNPAGLGTLTYYEIAALRQNALAGVDQSNLSLVAPLGAVSAGNVNGLGTIGVNATFLDYGKLKATDATGAPIGSVDAEDGLLIVGYGKSVGPLSAGLNVKRFRLQVGSDRGKGGAYDGGLLWRQPVSPLSFSLAVFNFGGNYAFESVPQKLPRYATAGMAYRWEDLFTFSAEAVAPKGDPLGGRAGVEWKVNRVFVLRGGYDSSFNAGKGATVGGGIVLEKLEAGFFPVHSLTADYAFTPAASTSVGGSESKSGLHSVSISMRIGE